MKWLLVLVVVVAALGAVTAFRANQQIKAAEAAFPPEGTLITVDGVQVHYVEKGEGPAVVLIHGASGNLRDFTFSMVDRLAQNYRVIAFDRPGMGFTGRTDPAYASAFANQAESPQEQAQLLIKAAAQLGVTNPIVVGHSFGGAVALAWGLEDAGAAALVLFAAASEPWPDELGLYYTIMESRLGGAIVPYLVGAYAPQSEVDAAITGVFAPQGAVDGYANHIGAPLSVRHPSFRANGRQVNTLRPHLVDMSPRYPTLTIPVEMLHGTADETVPLAVHGLPTSNAIPNASLELLSGVGHMPHHTDEDAAIAAIDRAAARAGLR